MGTTIEEMSRRIPGYLTIDEVKAIGPQTFTISKIDFVKIREDDDDETPVLFFEETAKRLTINKTRSQQLADLFGKGDPAGKQVCLKVDVIPVRNRKTEMIVLEAAD